MSNVKPLTARAQSEAEQTWAKFCEQMRELENESATNAKFCFLVLHFVEHPELMRSAPRELLERIAVMAGMALLKAKMDNDALAAELAELAEEEGGASCE